MADPVALVVLIAAGQLHAPETESLVRAASATAGARVLVEESTPTTTDDDAVVLEALAHARAVAIVSFSQQGARLRVRRDDPARWLDRTVLFQASDAPTERGRTVGFALASMLPDAEESRAEAPVATQPVAQAPSADRPSSSPRPPVSALPPGAASPRGAVDASALGTVAVTGSGGGLGAVLSARWYATRRLGLRAATALRTGQLAAAQASTLDVAGALGVAVTFFDATPSQPVQLGARADFEVVRLGLTRASSDATTTTDLSRFVPGASAMLEGALWFVPNSAVIVAAGPEVLFGTTSVYVSDRLVATLSPWRVSIEVGLRARF